MSGRESPHTQTKVNNNFKLAGFTKPNSTKVEGVIPSSSCTKGSAASSIDSFEVTKDDSSEDDDVSANRGPPIQNGFVVFIHQCRVVSSSKGKRTVVQWIRDALKMLDIAPQLITVDKLIERSKTALPLSTDEPIIKYAKAPTPNTASAKPKPGPSKSTLNTKTLKTATSNAFVQAKKSVTGTASRMSFSLLNKNHGAKNGPTASKPSKSTVSSKQSTKSPNNSDVSKKVKPLAEEKPKEQGVDMKIFTTQVRKLHQENVSTVWVLLVEARQRCMIDLGRLHKLASKYRFQVKWIAAQAPSLLDQNVFSVVNDIAQTRNICFPDGPATGMEPPVQQVRTAPKKPPRRRSSQSKSSVQVLHRASAQEFDATSFASADIGELISDAPCVVPNSIQTGVKGKTASSEDLDGQFPLTRQMSKEEIHKDLAAAAADKNCNNFEENANDLPPVSPSKSSEFRQTGTRPSTDIEECTRLVQLALIATKNPFATPWLRNDLPGFRGLFSTSEELKKRPKLETTEMVEANEGTEANNVGVNRNFDQNLKKIFKGFQRKFKRKSLRVGLSPCGRSGPEGANHSFGIKTCSQNNLSCTLCDSISPPASLSASFVPLRLSLGVAEKDGDMDAGTVSREALASEGKCLSEGVDEETFESIDLSDFSDLSQVEDEDTSEDEKFSTKKLALPSPRSSDLSASGNREALASSGLLKRCTSEVTLDKISCDNVDRIVASFEDVNERRKPVYNSSQVKASKSLNLGRKSSLLSYFSRLCHCSSVVRDR